MMFPAQEVFLAVRKICSEVIGEENTYDFLPMENVNYPFVFVGEQLQLDKDNKNLTFGTVRQMIHIWSDDYKDRAKLMKIVNRICLRLKKLKNTHSFYIHCRETEFDMTWDKSTGDVLFHGMITARIDFQ